MRNLLYKFSIFMQGRYGIDELNVFLLILSVVLNIVSSFMFSWVARLVLRLVSLGVLLIAVLRFLSRNISARSRENKLVKPVLGAIGGWFSLTYKRFRDGRTHRYYKCPACKAQLRVKNIKGKHTIRCPKCGNQFEKTIH